MNNYLLSATCIALSLYCTQSLSVIITASEFNQLYSCDNPFRPNETSTIILDEDIVITDTIGCLLIEAGPGFDLQTDVVTLTSSTSGAFIVSTSARWIIGLNITFNGNAQLQVLPGAILQFPDLQPILRMSGNSLFIPVQS